MNRSLCFMILCFYTVLSGAAPVFYDARPFLVGQAFDNCPPYGRLPEHLEESVRPPVWYLGNNSAGLAARFITDAEEIHVRWELMNDFHMVHMAGTGIRGLDLYVREGNDWSFVAVGKPYEKKNEARLISNMSREKREYLLYCPLYDGLLQLEIGISEGAGIEYPVAKNRPLVFYGTSITQGGCVSRPGMAYPAIVGRKLDRESINLGFSGNGRMDPVIMAEIAKIDAACIILDCLPNMTLEMVEERAEKEIRRILDAQPRTPLLLVPNFLPENGRYDPAIRNAVMEENAVLESIYKRLKKQYRNIHYLPYKKIRDVPREGTVDGIHLNDIGQLRMAEILEKHIKRLIKKR